MVDSKASEEQLLLNTSAFRLPATLSFNAQTSLDKEEKKATKSLDFLRRFPRRHKKVDPSQPPKAWSSLEASLEPISEKRPSSITPKRILQPSESEWHKIPEVKMTPELQRDLRVIENRQHLDPKRFYKSSGSGRRRGELPSRVQVGTVVVGAHEFYSARLTKRERKGRIMDQVLADERVKTYTKDRFQKLQQGRMISKRIIDPAAKRARRHKSNW